MKLLLMKSSRNYTLQDLYSQQLLYPRLSLFRCPIAEFEAMCGRLLKVGETAEIRKIQFIPAERKQRARFWLTRNRSAVSSYVLWGKKPSKELFRKVCIYFGNNGEKVSYVFCPESFEKYLGKLLKPGGIMRIGAIKFVLKRKKQGRRKTK